MDGSVTVPVADSVSSVADSVAERVPVMSTVPEMDRESGVDDSVAARVPATSTVPASDAESAVADSVAASEPVREVVTGRRDTGGFDGGVIGDCHDKDSSGWGDRGCGLVCLGPIGSLDMLI